MELVRVRVPDLLDKLHSNPAAELRFQELRRSSNGEMD